MVAHGVARLHAGLKPMSSNFPCGRDLFVKKDPTLNGQNRKALVGEGDKGATAHTTHYVLIGLSS